VGGGVQLVEDRFRRRDDRGERLARGASGQAHVGDGSVVPFDGLAQHLRDGPAPGERGTELGVVGAQPLAFLRETCPGAAPPLGRSRVEGDDDELADVVENPGCECRLLPLGVSGAGDHACGARGAEGMFEVDRGVGRRREGAHRRRERQ
jgi:hypothetical protein